jgi:hypothetical protein
VTDVTSGYDVPSGRETVVTSCYDVTSGSTEQQQQQQQQQYSQSNDEEFDLRFLIIPLVSFGHCVVCHLIYGL